MSDQDNSPPPLNDGLPEHDAQPSSVPGVNPHPMAPPPPVGSIGLGQGKLGVADEKTMGMLAHLLGGFFNFVGPLVIWLIKKDESPFVNDQGKEALNFQITIAISMLIVGVLNIGLAFIPLLGSCIGGLLFMAVFAFGLVYAILGGLQANKGIAYRYPFALRLIN